MSSNFKEGVFKSLEIIADAWLGYTWWGALSYFVFQIYSWSLLITGISVLSVVWAIVFLLTIPAGFSVVSRFILEYIHLFRLVPVLLNVLTLINVHIVRTAVSTVCLGAWLLALSSTMCNIISCGCSADPHQIRRKRLWTGIIFGNLLAMSIRECNWTLDPLFDSNITTPILSFVGLLCCIYLTIREPPKLSRAISPPLSGPITGTVSSSVEFMVYTSDELKQGGQQDSSEKSDKKCASQCEGVSFKKLVSWLCWPLASISISSSIFLTLFFFTNARFLPSFTLLPPPDNRSEEGSSLAISFSWLIGCILCVVWKKPTIPVWIFGFIGLSLLAFVNNAGGMIGGILLAVSLPLSLNISFRQTFRSAFKPVVLILSWIIFLLLYLSGMGFYTGSGVPLFGTLYNHKRGVLLIMFAGIFCSLILLQTIEYIILDNLTLYEFFLPKLSKKKKLRVFVQEKLPLFICLIIMFFSVCGLQIWRVGITPSRHSTPLQLNTTTLNNNQTFSVLTYNIFQTMNIDGKPNFKGVENVIRESNCDVAVFQEVDSLHFFTQGRDILPYLSYKLKMDSFSGLAGKTGSLDCSILSKSALFNKKAVILPSETTTSMTRPLAFATVNINGVEIVVITLHVELIGFDRETVIKEIEYISLLANSFAKETPIIILGDFNLQHNCSEIQPIYKIGFRNAYEDMHKNETFWTTYHYKVPESIDHVFYRGLNVVDSKIRSDLGGDISDHWPLQAWFTIP